MSTNKLDELRQQIDIADEHIVKWINERAKIAVEIGKLKALEGTPIYVPGREVEVLDHVDAVNSGPLPKGAFEEIYASILSASRQIQQ